MRFSFWSWRILWQVPVMLCVVQKQFHFLTLFELIVRSQTWMKSALVLSGATLDTHISDIIRTRWSCSWFHHPLSSRPVRASSAAAVVAVRWRGWLVRDVASESEPPASFPTTRFSSDAALFPRETVGRQVATVSTLTGQNRRIRLHLRRLQRTNHQEPRQPLCHRRRAWHRSPFLKAKPRYDFGRPIGPAALTMTDPRAAPGATAKRCLHRTGLLHHQQSWLKLPQPFQE